MHVHDGGNKMTEALQRSVESNQTADIFDIAQISPKDKVQICYSYADMDFLVVDIDAHVDTGTWCLHENSGSSKSPGTGGNRKGSGGGFADPVLKRLKYIELR